MQIKASYKFRGPWSIHINAANKGNKGTLTNQSRLCSRFSKKKAITGLFNRERVDKDQWTQRMKKVFQQSDCHWILQLGTMFRKKETGTKWYRQWRKQFNDDAFRSLFNRAECTRSRKTETIGLGFYKRHSIYSRLFIFNLCSSFRFLSPHLFLLFPSVTTVIWCHIRIWIHVPARFSIGCQTKIMELGILVFFRIIKEYNFIMVIKYYDLLSKYRTKQTNHSNYIKN